MPVCAAVCDHISKLKTIYFFIFLFIYLFTYQIITILIISDTTTVFKHYQDQYWYHKEVSGSMHQRHQEKSSLL